MFFVEDRQILDADLVVNDILDDLLHKNEEGVLCKHDAKKVYDHVN